MTDEKADYFPPMTITPTGHETSIDIPMGMEVHITRLPEDSFSQSPMTKHPDIGKRVKWTCDSETGLGTLMAVDCDGTYNPHIVQREDGGGWALAASVAERLTSARSQGVQYGTKNLYWVESYELMKRTIDNVKRGDWLVRDGFYRRVLDVRGEGELALVDISYECKSKDDDETKKLSCTYTLYELKELGLTLKDESPVEMTVAEISKKLGVTVKVVE